MATGQIFEISKNIAKGYRIPDAKPVSLRANGAGVTALMGIFNGSGAANRARRRAKTKNTPQGETDMAVKRARRRAKKKLKRSRRRAGNFARSFFIVRKGQRLRATARRNADFDTSDFSSSDDLVANRRRRRAKKARKSRKGKARRRMTAKQLKYFGPRRARKGRKAARRRVGKGRVYRARRSVTASRSKKGIKVLLRNLAQANRDTAKLKAELHELGVRAKSEKDAAKRAGYLQRAATIRATLQGHALGGAPGLPPWYNMTWRGLTPPWYREKAKTPKQFKPKYGGFAAQAALKGLTPRELAAAFHGLSDAKAREMFGSASRYQAWLQAMMLSPTFRSYTKKSRRHLGMPSWLTLGGGKKRKSRKGRKRRMTYKMFSRKYGVKKGARMWKKYKRSHKARRNFGYSPNLAFGSIKETLMTGFVGLGAFLATKLAAGYLGPMLPLGAWGPLVGNVLAGGLVIWGSDKVFKDPDKARAATVAATLSVLHAVAKQFLGATFPKAFGAYESQQPRYHLNGFGAPMYEATAGLGGGQIYQANAGFGEYMQAAAGMGEYVSSDGGLQPVSDFGEYVAANLSVEGFGDYEVAPGFSGTADGMGLINDGVRPDGNLSREMDIIEAAAGFGATGIPGQSRYLPDQGAAMVGRQEGASDTGIFDIGGANGILS